MSDAATQFVNIKAMHPGAVLLKEGGQPVPLLPGFAFTQLLAALGAAAIVFGSVVALRQQRLKLLIAYSTLAQIGYLFVMFPLAFGVSAFVFEADKHIRSRCSTRLPFYRRRSC